VSAQYQHPASGRIYRQGDPAHTYALALRAARRDAEQFLRETEHTEQMDYLASFDARPERATYRLRDDLDWLIHAEKGVLLERFRREPPDDEWVRKYGHNQS
jgi:hypothetical protein